MDNRGKWLDELLDELGWSAADLARETGLDSAVISNIRNGRRGIGLETAKLIGKAAKKSPETILRLAGQLPPEPEKDEWLEEQIYKLSKLDPERRRIAEGLIDALLEEPKPVTYKQVRKRQPASGKA